MASSPSYHDLGVAPKLIEVLKSRSFNRPTPIQANVWRPATEGRDLVALAETGSGKTLAYLLPLFKQLLADESARALIMTPSRETADQIYQVIDPFATEFEFSLSLIIGGRDAAKQKSELKKKSRLIVATPGRLNDHLLNNKLLLQGVKVVVIDEADRMLDMGFSPQLKSIQKTMRGEWQTMLFSASEMTGVMDVARLFMKSEPEMIRQDSVNAPVAELHQRVIRLERRDKNECLFEELSKARGSVIVFTASQERCDHIFNILSDEQVSVEHLHGGLMQGHRARVVRQFRNKEFQVLVATDLIARGLDIPHVELVINMDLPYHAEDFLHRIGRTARAGRKGRAVTLITAEDREMYEAIQIYLEGAEVEAY